ncbi:hypothetical protein V6N11_013785 [Hibiscus sabdariffa]|uniref:RNase H type-1 domain-containing protein n=2 Tax=Hibiscus sabdariffa TaxID=183260 RepID=A0ABR2PCY4_9ROSI
MAWCPLHGFLKLNVDGVMLHDSSAGGIGGLLRDGQGKVLFQFSRRLGPGLPISPEILTIDHGLKLIRDNGFFVRHIPRSSNVEADSLAKAGIG